tara:strand:+ start:311 stop:931 length:621 start_codon:yes stop_codon:yes gene_type:complete
MKTIVKLCFIVIFLASCSYIQAENIRTMHLIDYLKPNLLGKKVSVLLNNMLRPVKMKIRNIEFIEDAYFAKLSNGDYLTISFQTTSAYERLKIDGDKKKMHLQVNALKSQEIINQSIQSTFSESSESFKSSSLKNVEDNIESLIANNYFTTAVEINYTDIKAQKKHKEKNEHFIITNKGLYLQDGRRIKIIIGINAIEGKSIGKNK